MDRPQRGNKRIEKKQEGKEVRLEDYSDQETHEGEMNNNRKSVTDENETMEREKGKDEKEIDTEKRRRKIRGKFSGLCEKGQSKAYGAWMLKTDSKKVEERLLEIMQRKGEKEFIVERVINAAERWERKEKERGIEMMTDRGYKVRISKEGIRVSKDGNSYEMERNKRIKGYIKTRIRASSFKLSLDETRRLLRVSLFIVSIYAKVWFEAPMAIKAINIDLTLTEDLYEFKRILPDVDDAALTEIRNHPWYFVPETSALSFLNRNVPIQTKMKMVEALQIDVEVERESPKKLIVNNGSDLDVLSGRDMDSSINSYSLRFFERFEIKTDFLKLSVESWDSDPDFLDELEVVRRLRVVNDTAERAVKRTEKYTNRREDEDLKQALASNHSTL
ncbi:hypothetical protein QAD02_007226 [Eretmocerus hayati]|uniref:Uncharacterized protein n=1 Tax=Eretmocerus hayati TaxID=131215 RepID=A0ACC2N3D9_9HYME|nr:hypothetical protein QAD02_007226 [Eretmocerus hayati]